MTIRRLVTVSVIYVYSLGGNVFADTASSSKADFSHLKLTTLEEIVRLRQAEGLKAEPPSDGDSIRYPIQNIPRLTPEEQAKQEAQRDQMWRRAVQKRRLEGQLIDSNAQVTKLQELITQLEASIPVELAALERQLRSEYVIRTQIDWLGRYISVVEPRYTAAQIQAMVAARERELQAEMVAYRQRIAKMEQQRKQLQRLLNTLKSAPERAP